MLVVASYRSWVSDAPKKFLTLWAAKVSLYARLANCAAISVAASEDDGGLEGRIVRQPTCAAGGHRLGDC